MESSDRVGSVPATMEYDDEFAHVRLMSTKEAAAEREKQKRLEQQRLYDKKRREEKKRSTKENRKKLKEDGQCSLTEAIVSSNGLSLLKSDVVEDVMADKDHGILCSDVKGEDDCAGFQSMILGSRNRAAEHGEGDEGYEHVQDVNSSYTGGGADPENEHGAGEECMLWEKEQIVVMMSRPTLGTHIYIVSLHSQRPPADDSST